MRHRAFDVYLNNRKIDTVFYSESHHANDTTMDAEQDVYRSLINHDGYDSGIVVKCVPMRKEKH